MNTFAENVVAGHNLMNDQKLGRGNDMKAIWLIVAFIAASWTVPTHAARPTPTTLSTSVAPIFESGELRGCQLEFQVVRSDPEYSGGRLVHISGNLSFWIFEEKSPSVGLRLAVSEVSKIYDKKPPSDAYLIDGYKTNISDLLGKSDGEGGSGLFAYKLGESTSNVVFDNIIADRKFTFNYSMIERGLGANVLVDLTVEKLDLENTGKNVIGDRTVNNWAECVRQAADAEVARLEVQDAADNK